MTSNDSVEIIESRHHLPFPVRWGGRLILKVLGWEMVGTLEGTPRGVAITTHTSNWDGLLGISFALAMDVRARWLGKVQLFRGPFGPVLKMLGGIPVNRSAKSNLVDAAIEHLKTHDVAYIVIAPEGSRSKTDYWKSGFYRIALQANVPILLGQVDYEKKQVGIGQVLYPTGDVEADLAKIRAFYEKIPPKYPENLSPVRFKEKDIEAIEKLKSA